MIRSSDEIVDKINNTRLDDIQQLVNTSNWTPLTIFLNFLLTEPNSEPNCLVNISERKTIFYEIYFVF